MIHISKTPKGFQVTTVEEQNGKVINSSKGLDSKAACIKNIKASAEEHNTMSLYFQDDTVKKPIVWYMYHNNLAKWVKEKSNEKPVKPYVV
jgi:uncharacterized protein YegP (UPF0339 family)